MSDLVVPRWIDPPGQGYVHYTVAQAGHPRIDLWVHRSRVGRDPGYLVHLALLALARRRLGADEARWELPRHVGDAVPDALWYREDGVWAVEVDRTYPREKVERKAKAYAARYSGQVWVVPSRRRAAHLRRLLRGLPLEVLILGLRDLKGDRR